MMVKLIQPRLNYSLSLSDWLRGLINFRSKPFVPEGIKTQFLHDQIFMLDHARSGIRLALSLLPVGARVGVQPLTCPTVLEAIELSGCSIVFIDINERLVIDELSLHKAEKSIDALIVTHTFGHAASIAPLKVIMGDRMIIEDCAHAVMTTDSLGQQVGQEGDFSIFSFGFAKFPSAVQGGYLILNNNKYKFDFERKYKELDKASLYDSIVNLFKMTVLPVLNNPIIYSFFTSKLKNYKKDKSVYNKITIGKQMTDGHGANCYILDRNVKLCISDIVRQKLNAENLIISLQMNDHFTVLPYNDCQNYFMLPVLIDTPDDFVEYALKNGIEVGRHFVQSKSFIGEFGYQIGDCVNYEFIVERLITFSCHYKYPEKQIYRLKYLIENYLN